MNNPRGSARSVLTALALTCCLCTDQAEALTDASTTNGFGAVGKLAVLNGVQIAPNWVITSAKATYCLVPDDGTSIPSVYSNANGTSKVAEFYRFSDILYQGNDIALVRLSSALPVDAIPVLNSTMLGDDVAGVAGTVVTATFTSSSRQNYGAISLDKVVPTYSDKYGTYVANWVTRRSGSDLEVGDYGAALFKGTLDGTESAAPVLLGLGSQTRGDPWQEVTPSAFVQVAAYRSWIDATMAASGQSAQWTAPVPEPSTWALGLLGGVAAVTVARRRRV